MFRLDRLWARPLLLLPFPPLLWAGNLVLGRVLAETFPPVSLAMGRWPIAFVVVLPFVAGRLWRARTAPAGSWKIILLCGAFGIAGYNALGYIALRTVPTASVAFLNSTLPLMVPLAAALLGVERVTPRTLAGIAVSFVGVFWIATRGDPASLAVFGVTGGEPLMLLAVANYALYSVLVRRRPASLDPLVFLSASIAAGLAVLTPFWIAELASGARIPLDAASIGAVLYIGIFASLAAFILWNRCVTALGPSVTSASFHLVAIFTVALAAIVLHEPVHAYHLVGGALILGGFALTTLSGPRSRVPDDAAAGATQP